MPGRRTYVTTSLPYVNGSPHVGFALELVQADALARHGRSQGREVRLLSGTDDNSLKNVLAAEAEGVSTAELVERNAGRFAALEGSLGLAFDDFIRTSADPRHRPGVERLWRASAAAGDLYPAWYEGLYCVGCEQFYPPEELLDGRCPDHGTVPERVAEENWFFRLSRYRQPLIELIESGRLRILPEFHAREVLAFLRAGLQDLSVSRSRERARGWGIPVPGDPGQVIYVWFDALGNYVTALDYGTGGDEYRRWWLESDERVHLVGKGILRFHAVHWPAMLLSAGQPLPTSILVHQYLTVGGRKISKSAGGAADPAEQAARHGTDALRWWLLREVGRLDDTDFTEARLVACANRDLADGLGNLVNRTVAMVHRFRGGRVPAASAPGRLDAALECLPAGIEAALARFDFRAALAEAMTAVDAANRLVSEARPWELSRAELAGDAGAGAELDAVLAALVRAGRHLSAALAPFTPRLAERVAAQLAGDGETLPPPQPVFPRLSECNNLDSGQASS